MCGGVWGQYSGGARSVGRVRSVFDLCIIASLSGASAGDRCGDESDDGWGSVRLRAGCAGFKRIAMDDGGGGGD